MADLFDLPFEDETPEEDAAVTAAPTPVAARRVLTVTELTVRVRDLLEGEFAAVLVQGELSNCFLSKPGHIYFVLKDGAAQIRGVIFRSALRYLKFKPADGLAVVARGRISVYEPKGEYQLVCEFMEPQGLGALQLAFDQLRKRLQDEGLFDAGRKRPLPALPRKIGIVTSLDGAAIHDIIKVLHRRHANARIVIRPARVQGDGAALDVARGLRAVARVPGVDVVIVGRGGGSIEDLWAFNEEIVARAIAQCPVPVISAVGHESDVTIADFVADLRAPTPSAAAEMVVAATTEFSSRIERLQGRLSAATRSRIQGLGRRVHAADGRPVFAGFRGRLAMRGRYAGDLTHALERVLRAALGARERRRLSVDRQLAAFDPGRRLGQIRARLVGAREQLTAAAGARHHRARERFTGVAARLEALSPLAVLGRGYAMCWTGDGARLVRTVADVGVGDAVRVTLSDGTITAKVSETRSGTE